jgi:hypothetical protein
MSDKNPTPLGRTDAGDPLYVVHDETGYAVSHHRTAEGAEAVRPGYGDKATISVTTLYR